MLNPKSFTPSLKAQAFIDSLAKDSYDRQIVAGIKKFADQTVPDEMKSLYTAEEIKALTEIKGTDRDIESRMPVKITGHYFQQAKNSEPLQRLIKADPEETYDLAGAPDPGNQLTYSPVEGMIHKYELGLLYVVSTCSAHCRFCYREELIAGKEIDRIDGSVAAKGLAQINEIVAYIEDHNRQVEENGGRHPETGREKLREILMSGGDPMVLGNKKLANWWSALTEAGIEQIRIGTKELAFFPDRFDETFFDMVDKFHQNYSGTKLRFVIHFNHPDEFLKKHDDGNYIDHPAGGLAWLDNTKRSIDGLASRKFITIDNQSPIIRGINDDPIALRIMQRELRRNRVENHYFFCGRDIIGHKAFNVPIETAWEILNESQKGLSGVESHARLSITHYQGKTEIVAVTDDPIPGAAGSENGFMIFKLHRSVADAKDKGKITIVGRNPEAIWFDGYEDRVIYDGIGLFG